MILELSIMALVVTSPPPPPATAAQQACKYSIRESSDTYVCYTEQEYMAMKNAERQAAEEANRQLGESLQGFWQWLLNHWWQILIGIPVLIVLLFALWIVADAIEQKRHPERFYANGLRKGAFGEDWRL